MTVAITFRTTDNTKWGAGTDGILSAEQVDLNFWALKQAVEALQTDFPDAAVGIDAFSVEGSQFYVDLTDGSRQGPYDLPMITWTFRQSWTSETSYTVGDIVLYGSALYYVLTSHYSALTFDPNATDGEGNTLYSLMFDLTGVSLPKGGTTGQYLAKKSGSDYDTEWVDGAGSGSAGELSVGITATSAELIEDSDLGTDPTLLGTPWEINDNTWSTNFMECSYSGTQYPAISIPVSGLTIGEMYVLHIEGTIDNDIRWVNLSFAAPDDVYMPGTGSHVFKATATSGTLFIDFTYYKNIAYHSITSISIKSIASLANGIQFTNGIDVFGDIGLDQTSFMVGQNSGAVTKQVNGSFTDLTYLPDNIAIGIGTLSSAANPTRNVAIGSFALAASDNGENVAIGYRAMVIGRMSSGCVAIGAYASEQSIDTNSLVSIGYAANRYATGNDNVAIGSFANGSLTSGIDNIGIGSDALSGLTTGNENIAIGTFSGYYNHTGSQNISIGKFAGPASAALSNTIAIGSDAAVSTSDTVQLGNSSMKRAYIGTKAVGLPQHAIVTGGAAGTFTVTGIAVGDRIDEVIYYPSSYDVIDLTSEFTITSANTITNAGGTASTGGKLLIRWTSLN